ncbi:hypothetical protein LUZ61_016961 [Rhynchospora tenuis]|uniref:F-box domain-containing protein n=1 Tax=Rhynchospora tenuis TaxID=198213 RepID=A0AAD6EKJ1_9POAL|nr:hypothetical protein LUZ61_016961 [Rhynchospora tenuis]
MEGDNKNVLPTNWAELPHDLLHAINRRLDDFFDFLNFRAVCKCWRAAAPLSEQPPQFPLLLEREHHFSSDFETYSIHTGKSRRLQVPEAKNRKFVGQSNGYLVTYLVSDRNDYACPALLNPFTRAELSLPFRKLKPYYAGPNWGNYEFYKPIYVGADPIRNPREVVIYMDSAYTGLCVGYWKSENNEWALKYSLPAPVQVYQKGRLFICNYQNSSTMAIGLTTRETLQVKFPPNQSFRYLVEGSGMVLGIRQVSYETRGTVPLERCRFEVYRLDEEDKPPRWVKTSDIGDLMIFLNSRDGFCSSASDFDGMSGNCIYFTRWNGMKGHSQLLIGRYELGKDGSEVVGHRSTSNTDAIWIVPNFY